MRGGPLTAKWLCAGIEGVLSAEGEELLQWVRHGAGWAKTLRMAQMVATTQRKIRAHGNGKG